MCISCARSTPQRSLQPGQRRKLIEKVLMLPPFNILETTTNSQSMADAIKTVCSCSLLFPNACCLLQVFE